MRIPRVSNFLKFSLETGSLCISGFRFVIAFSEFFVCVLLSIVSCKDNSDSECISNRIFIETGMAISAVEMVVNIILFVGVFLRNAVTLVLWLITEIIVVLIFLIHLLVIGNRIDWSETLLILYITTAFISLCLFVYMWIVVYSHYVVLKEENARGQYDKTTYRAT